MFDCIHPIQCLDMDDPPEWLRYKPYEHLSFVSSDAMEDWGDLEEIKDRTMVASEEEPQYYQFQPGMILRYSNGAHLDIACQAVYEDEEEGFGVSIAYRRQKREECSDIKFYMLRDIDTGETYKAGYYRNTQGLIYHSGDQEFVFRDMWNFCSDQREIALSFKDQTSYLLVDDQGEVQEVKNFGLIRGADQCHLTEEEERAVLRKI